jgi:hypothetical protein
MVGVGEGNGAALARAFAEAGTPPSRDARQAFSLEQADQGDCS